MTRTIAVLVAALLPVVAAAQSGALKTAKEAKQTSDAGNARVMKAADEAAAPEPAAGAQPAAPAPAGAADVVPGTIRRPEGSAATADRGTGSLPPPDTYTVRPGDTLWDLSGRFLNNPWYWPKVWSFNPEISNPHWIEPGNLLKFYPSAEEAPTRVEPVAEAPGAAPVAEEPGDVEPPRVLEAISRADMKAPVPVEDRDEVMVVGPYKVGYVLPKTIMIRRDSFVTPSQLQESGSIVAAFEEKLMLSTSDRAYARFKGEPPSKLGETYVIYQTLRAIHHPLSGDLIGYQTRILGAGVVVAKDPRAVTLVISQALAPIERGALLGPWTEKTFRPVTPRPNATDLDGRIVGTRLEVLSQIAEQNVVFIDKGKVDGVEEGNVFKVMRSGDPYGLPLSREQLSPPNDPSLPAEVLGELMIIDVKESTSTALVMKSRRELLIGDEVKMRATGGGR